jgi:hypothetical protein
MKYLYQHSSAEPFLSESRVTKFTREIFNKTTLSKVIGLKSSKEEKLAYININAAPLDENNDRYFVVEDAKGSHQCSVDLTNHLVLNAFLTSSTTSNSTIHSLAR